MVGDIFRCTGGYDCATAVTTFRSKVDNPISGFYHIQVVFNDDDGIAVIAEPVQYGKQLFNIVEVQAGSGFIKDVQRVSCVAFGQFTRQFYPLRFATGQSRGALAQFYIIKTDLGECFKLSSYAYIIW